MNRKIANAMMTKSKVAWTNFPYPSNTSGLSPSAATSVIASFEKSTPPISTPITGMMMSATSDDTILPNAPPITRSEEHTSELQSLMRISYAVFCLKKKKHYIVTQSQIIIKRIKHTYRQYIHTEEQRNYVTTIRS